jgi:hypothetical protein
VDSLRHLSAQDRNHGEDHRRELPESIAASGQGEGDPDRRILQMLSARGSHTAAAASSRGETS